MMRYSYDEKIKPNWVIDNHINQRVEKLKVRIKQFDDLLELYQILLYVDKTEKLIIKIIIKVTWWLVRVIYIH